MIDGHGGNIYQLAQRLNCRTSDIVDMSANVNPLGPMPELVDHLKVSLSAIASLPEVDARGIVDAFARFHGIDPAGVMAGNGTTQLIYLIPRALEAKQALIVGPTYADYQDACVMNRVPVDRLTSHEQNGFVPDIQAIVEKAATADLVFLCNPNNPTGILTHRADIEALCRACPNTVFVIDESYLPFTTNPADASLIGDDLPNAVVLNSMSKAFRIPGLRIGFLNASESVMEKLAFYRQPWSVNGLAQAAVHWLMTHRQEVDAFLAKSYRFINEQKSRMISAIHDQTPIRTVPSATSFVLMRLPGGLTASVVWEFLADHRILIRDCANFAGLSDAFIRVSLKNEAENQRAVRLLVQLCREHAGREDCHAC